MRGCQICAVSVNTEELSVKETDREQGLEVVWVRRTNYVVMAKAGERVR